MRYLLTISALLLTLTGCTETVSRDAPARILAMGDSMLAVHGATGQSVSHAVERSLGEDVIDRSVMGAKYFYALPISGSAGLNIRKQYVDGNWDWVVLNGGGNDIWFGCGCGRCDNRIDRLISKDGKRGTIPGFVSDLRQKGSQVILVGYLRTPGVTSPIEGCRDEGDEMDRRLSRLSKLDRGVHFLSLADVVPHGDRSYHTVDLIHPSAKGSTEIGKRVAEIIRKTEARRR
ncbi:SGNH/GDSL hydrolase family protein [Roseovarius sp. A21]|uniref:SGNH/GDSL hydrolase family protein n=1 Tax=Roseovarius bejariae TaxID=2576383 RepID=A0A844D1X1_9RHOB|nr:SGNH/GDSL hydrolase family protein [Roseovarius bejariae]MRU15843.1 SGNH/GDSL hydrolase family protein [Roseovarius bejariae]